MTEREPPDRRSLQKKVNLMDVLDEIGHTPESFARLIGRNASGLRRIIRGETKMTSSAAKDIAEGLVAEGWEGELMTIPQLNRALHRSASPELAARLSRASTYRRSVSGTQVSAALANLMHYLGREEVDRVYGRVFGAKPGEKE